MTEPTRAATTTIRLVQPYLFFDGRCDEALEYYVRHLGAQITNLMRFNDSPEPTGCVPAPAGDKVMHASFRIGATELFASDGMASGAPKFEGFALSLSVPTADAAEKTFAVLANGGNVTMPLARTFFSPSFGMVTDRFGVNWMVIVSAA